MAEMKTPKKFGTALTAANILILAVYLSTMCIYYAYTGAGFPATVLPDVIPGGKTGSIVDVFLLVHLTVSYTISSQVLTRQLLAWWKPSALAETTPVWTARGYWLLVSGALLVAAYIVMNLIPFFDELVGLIGSLVLSQISLGFPVFGYW